MKNHKTTILFYLSIFTAILAVGVFIFFINVIKNKNRHTSAVLTTLEDKINQKENIATLEKKLIELEETRQDIDSHFVNSSQIDSFISYLEELGVDAGAEVEVKSVEIAKEENTIIGQLSARGTFTNVMEVVNLIEIIPYQIHVTSIYLNKSTESGATDDPSKGKVSGPSTWQADVSFKILSSS